MIGMERHRQTGFVDAECASLLKVPKKTEPYSPSEIGPCDSSDPTEVQKQETAAGNIKVLDQTIVPDDSWGLIVCFGSFTVNLILDGTMFSFGVLMLQLLSDLGQDKSTTSWIGSAQMGIHMCMGPVVSILLRHYSIRQVVVAGSLVASVGFVASVFAPNVYVLILTYGVISGIGFGMIFLPAIIVVGLYFSSKRAIATGIATSGSGVGTFAYAYIMDILLEHFDWRGTVLILAALLLHCVICGLLFRPLLPHPRSVRTVTVTITAVPELTTEDITVSNATCNKNQSQSQHSFLNTETRLCHPVSLPKGTNLGSCLRDQGRLYRSLGDICKVQERDGPSESGEDIILRKNKSERRLDETAPNRIGSSLKSQSNSEVDYPTWNSDADFSNRYLPVSNMKICTCKVDLNDTPTDMQLKNMTASKSIFTEANLRDKTDLTSRQDVCMQKSACRTLSEWFSLRLLTNKTFVLLLVTFTMWTAQSIFMTYLPDLAVSRGISSSDAAFLISIVGISNVLGRLFAGFLTDCFHVPSIWLYFVALSVAAVVNSVVPFCGSYLLLQLLSAVFGLCMAVAVSMRTIVLIEQLGVQALTESFGIVSLFQGIAFTLDPPIAGKLIDDFHSFKPPFVMAATMYAISALSALAVGCLSHFSRKNSQEENEVVMYEKE